jgi:hypothetical protein
MAYRDSAAASSAITVVESNVTGVSTSTTAATNVTSISLTAGTWAISCNLQAESATNNIQRVQCGISTASATFQGNLGDQQTIQNCPSLFQLLMSCTIANYILTIGSTTTVYLIGRADFSSGSVTLDGKLSALKIG